MKTYFSAVMIFKLGGVTLDFTADELKRVHACLSDGDGVTTLLRRL